MKVELMGSNMIGDEVWHVTLSHKEAKLSHFDHPNTRACNVADAVTSLIQMRSTRKRAGKRLKAWKAKRR